MGMKRGVVAGLALVLGVFMTAGMAHADMNVDVRVKLGNAAGIEHVELTNIGTADASEDGGGNFQVELVLSQKVDAGATLVGGVGLFGRTHKGTVPDPFFPTDVEYDAGGVSGTIGVGIPAGPNLHFEGRVELDLGRGEPTLSTPGAVWNSTQDGAYVAGELLFGGYYTVSKPGLQLGLELGVQSFTGEFQIWNNAGYWNDAKVKGSGGIINFVIGARF